jgi:hypothetical protein
LIPASSWTDDKGSKGIFIHDDFLTVGMIDAIGLEGRVPYAVSKRRIRTVPIAVLLKIAIADVVVNPPAMEGKCACVVIVRRNSAVTVLEGCHPVMTAGAVQGDRAIVALSLQPQKARSALRVMPEELTRKEITCDKEVQGVTVGRAPNAPHNNRLHVVMVISTSGITGLE